MGAKSLQSCLTLCDPMDCNPPGSSVHAILQARILEWVAMPPPGDLPEPGIEPSSLMSPALQADSLPAEPPYSHYGAVITTVHLQNFSSSQTETLYPLNWNIPWRREWQATPVFLPGKSDGRRSLVGYGPWGRKESDTTE